MKHSIHLPNDLDRLVGQLMAIQRAERPGSRPNLSALVAEALVCFIADEVIQREKTRGVHPETQEKTQQLAAALRENYGIKLNA